ncbi:hypothetical protein [Paracoccus sphaerophysae]|uniref:Uncharacterized protein n=1 Tax=Paracoccus sphaerophysae TaxID=690417 RepID=A0A099EWW9_9RHOB|nr:hypothetical protein [Paracoccus sphaerophysae]KGJ02448.1 hypothetical protein IC63_14715 [Paracoccus sphaerophysae]
MTGHKEHLSQIEYAISDLENLICALCVVAEPFAVMPETRLSSDEVDARNGLIGLRDALKWQCRKLGDAYEAAWKAA